MLVCLLAACLTSPHPTMIQTTRIPALIQTADPRPDSHRLEPHPTMIQTTNPRPDSNHESPPTPLVRATRTPALIRALKPT